MQQAFTSNIIEYGYYAIFLLVFLQEVGFPSPIPNEFILIFSGYLCSLGTLFLPFNVLAAVGGDLVAGFMLYVIFRYFGNLILQRKPKWIPISQTKLDNISQHIKKKGVWFVFVGRLTPFIRGYVAVLSGLMQFPFKKYGFVMWFTSPLWAVFYICGGYYLCPYWDSTLTTFFPEHGAIITICCSALLIMVLFLRKHISFLNPFKIKTIQS